MQTGYEKLARNEDCDLRREPVTDFWTRKVTEYSPTWTKMANSYTATSAGSWCWRNTSSEIWVSQWYTRKRANISIGIAISKLVWLKFEPKYQKPQNPCFSLILVGNTLWFSDLGTLFWMLSWQIPPVIVKFRYSKPWLQVPIANCPPLPVLLKL